MPHPDLLDIFRSHLISVVDSTTTIADHHPSGKVELAPVPATLGTVLTGSFPTVYDPHFPAILVALCFAEGAKHPPPLPTNRLGQLTVFQHPAYIEVFQTSHLAFAG